MATEKEEKNICFVIMPISDPEGYTEGHFKKIYDQVFAPAITKAGYEPMRADNDNSANMIQPKIIEQLVNSPMVLCDLSTRNPNVLFELGLRQAFDKPVVLVQECGTERIFDISSISTIDYRRERLYDEVLEDQQKITECIIKTAGNSTFNSLISFLEISKATTERGPISGDDAIQMMLRSIMNEIGFIKADVKSLQHETQGKYYRINDAFHFSKSDQNPFISATSDDAMTALSQAIKYRNLVERDDLSIPALSKLYRQISDLLDNIPGPEEMPFEGHEEYRKAFDLLIEGRRVCKLKMNKKINKDAAEALLGK